jgi:hypothetical protein
MNLRKILPFESYTITTKLTPAQINEKLIGCVRINGARPPNNTTKEFRGTVHPFHFKIERILTYRNSFQPVIQGQVYQGLNESTIHVTMRPFIGVIVFMCFWLGTVGIVCSFILITALMRWKELLQHGFSPMMLIPFVLFIFGSLLCVVPFKMEAKNSKAFLENLFKDYSF